MKIKSKLITKESLRFFDDKDLAKEINLTKEEVEIFDKFEWAVLCDNGLRQINGAYSKVTVYDVDEDDEENEILLCEAECGEQNMGDGHSSSDKWEVEYNRETKKFV
jgi:hypothetical protein